MKILLIGCGHMGSAMLAGWLRRDDIERVVVVDPGKPAITDPRVRVMADGGDVSGSFDMVVLAVKPQVMNAICADLAPRLSGEDPVLSIAAGITLDTLAKHFGSRPLVRAMPNTPGAIGQGITGYVMRGKFDQKQIDTVDRLLGVLGNVVQIPDETMMDAVTAVSGSGPAYVFALTEALEKAAKASGLPDDVAVKLARQTVVGAAALMDARADTSPEALRKAVTSPGGTTAAALSVLMQNRALDTLLEEAVLAAKKRGNDLAQSQ